MFKLRPPFVEMKYLSLFSGIGGFELGIGNMAECVGYSEIDKYAIQIYQKHFPNHTNYGDITKIVASYLPNFDLLVGGFPCQSFSIAGKRGGFKDTRGTLFFDIARILKEKKPTLLFLENVKGLLNHDKGNTFATIIATLDELGYDCQWSVLNSKNFGVPQNRERVFIIGHLRGTSRPKIFPFGQDNKDTVKKEWEKQDFPSDETQERKGHSQYPNGKVLENGKDGHLHQINQPNHSNDRVFGQEGIAPTLNTMQGGRRQPKILFEVNTKKGYAEAKEGDGINLSFPNSKTRRGRVIKENSPTLQTNGNGMVGTIQNMKIRRLTPMECERLQGFPDNWTEGISDTQRYKCLGNAVTVNVIKAIVGKLL